MLTPHLDAVAARAAGRTISIEHDLIPALVPLLSARSSGVQEMAAFALARLAQLPSYQAAIVQVCAAVGCREPLGGSNMLD